MFAPLKVLCFRVLCKAGLTHMVPDYLNIESPDGTSILSPGYADTSFIGHRSITQSPCPRCNQWFSEKSDHCHAYRRIYFGGWVVFSSFNI